MTSNGSAQHGMRQLAVSGKASTHYTSTATTTAAIHSPDFSRRALAPFSCEFVAAAVCEFVRAHDLLRQYLPAVEREAAEAREQWERCRPAREQLSAAKAQLARLQGRFYALLELGFTRPEPGEVVDQRER